MLQDAVQPADWPQEIEYVPDLICPNCANVMRVPREGYSWYAGNVPCGRCQCQVQVEIGDYETDYLGRKYPTTIPFDDSPGGKVLETPKVVERARIIPLILVQGTEAEKIPETLREIFRTAIQGFEEGRYDDAVVRCRVTLEATLRRLDVAGDTPSSLVAAAHRDRLLSSPYEKYGQIVVAMGGGSAHGGPPVSQADALLVIGLIASLLRRLYDV